MASPSNQEQITWKFNTPKALSWGGDNDSWKRLGKINSTADDDSDDWAKRERYVQWCKKTRGKDGNIKYLIVLRVKHNLSHKDRTRKANIGDIVMIKFNSTNPSTVPIRTSL